MTDPVLLVIAIVAGAITVGCLTAIVVLRRKDRRIAENELREARRYRIEDEFVRGYGQGYQDGIHGEPRHPRRPGEDSTP